MDIHFVWITHIYMYVYIYMYTYIHTYIVLINSSSRPLYDGESGVCVYFVYVYIFCDLLVSFGCLWSSTLLFSLGRLWACFWEPLGRFGLRRGPPWRHFGFPLAPLGRRGAIWGTLGSQVELGMTLGRKWISFFVIIWSVCDACT